MAHPAQQLAAAGFHLDLLPGGKIKVEPVQLLTREWVVFVRAHRSELIEALTAEASNDHRLTEAPAPNPEPPLVRPPPATPPPAADPDRATWPHGPAMNAAEVRRMAARLRTFEAQGMPLDEAEAEADRLMHLERTRSSPAPLSAVPPPATPPAPAKRIYQLPDRELDRASQRHHFTCPHCIAAGKGYGLRCTVGLTMYLVAAGDMPMH